jgi:hypothetical protein
MLAASESEMHLLQNSVAQFWLLLLPCQQLLPPLQQQVQALQVQHHSKRNTLQQLPGVAPAPNPNDLWLDVYSANALSRVGGLSR